MTRCKNRVPLFNIKHDYFKSSFFPSTGIEWDKLDPNTKKFWESGAFQCQNPKGLKLITKLRLGLSHLWFHKCKHSFQDTLNPICNCGTVETTIHHLLHCPNFSNERLTLFNKLRSIDENILSKDDFNISKLLLCGDYLFNNLKSTSILTASNEYIISIKRFDAPLYQSWQLSICICFSFCQEIVRSFILLSFVFSIFSIVFFRLLGKILCIISRSLHITFIYVYFINLQKFALNLTIQ